MLANTYAASVSGVEARLVDVQVHMGRGLPGFELVGLAETTVKESRVRVRSAIMSQGLELPAQKIVVNLAPADLKKSGSAFDVAIAVGLVAGAGGCTLNRLSETLLLGELTLGGRVTHVKGALACLRAAERSGLRYAVIPSSNAYEAGVFAQYSDRVDIRLADTLKEVMDFLSQEIELKRVTKALPVTEQQSVPKDFAQVHGQQVARRALEIGAVGGHHVMMVGPPGAGKTMLAERWPTILPPPTAAESLEIATIASAAGLPLEWTTEPSSEPGSVMLRRPFRAPHHSATHVALLGGGDPIVPGEITLAHGGVLFLDELPEFARPAVEALRITMESGVVRIARARQRIVLPAKPRVIAAMNPCPCGYLGESTRVCVCSPFRIANYQSRVSGPVLDRFDMHIQVNSISSDDLSRSTPEKQMSSQSMRAAVIEATAFRNARRRDHRRSTQADEAEAGELIFLTRDCTGPALGLLNHAFDKLRLSPRAYVKVLRVARSIADLAKSTTVERDHIAEAIQYRILDRQKR